MRQVARVVGARIALVNGSRSIRKSWSKLRMIILPAADFGTAQGSCDGGRTRRLVNARWNRWNTVKANRLPSYIIAGCASKHQKHPALEREICNLQFVSLFGIQLEIDFHIVMIAAAEPGWQGINVCDSFRNRRYRLIDEHIF